MRMADAEAMGMEYFVAETLDTGFRNVDVFRTLQKVMASGKGVRGMDAVFKAHLGMEGYKFATLFCDVWIREGMWGWIAYSMDRLSVQGK